MKLSDIVQVVDAEHILVNGAMLDVPALRYYFESNTWAHHSPFHTYITACGYIICLAADPTYLDHDELSALIPFLKLGVLAGYGFSIPDQVFSIVPRHKLFIRSHTKNGHGFRGIYWTGYIGNLVEHGKVITTGYLTEKS